MLNLIRITIFFSDGETGWIAPEMKSTDSYLQSSKEFIRAS